MRERTRICKSRISSVSDTSLGIRPRLETRIVSGVTSDEKMGEFAEMELTLLNKMASFTRSSYMYLPFVEEGTSERDMRWKGQRL